MRNKEKEICSFEEFVEKETNKEMLQCFIISFIIALCIMLLIIPVAVINKSKNVFEIKETEYNKVYELQDNSWFIIDRENDKFIFQPIELGDWDYELKSEDELEKILATYFINKYNIEETKAIQEVNKMIGGIK